MKEYHWIGGNILVRSKKKLLFGYYLVMEKWKINGFKRVFYLITKNP